MSKCKQARFGQWRLGLNSRSCRSPRNHLLMPKLISLAESWGTTVFEHAWVIQHRYCQTETIQLEVHSLWRHTTGQSLWWFRYIFWSCKIGYLDIPRYGHEPYRSHWRKWTQDAPFLQSTYEIAVVTCAELQCQTRSTIADESSSTIQKDCLYLKIMHQIETRPTWSTRSAANQLLG